MRSALFGAGVAIALCACGSSDEGDAADANDTGNSSETAIDPRGDGSEIGSDASSDARAETAPGSDAEGGTDAGITRRLLKHGQDIPTAQFVHDHVATMETMPFDGVVVSIASSANVQRATAIAESEFATELAPMKDATFTTLTHNFVMVHATPPGASWFDDDANASANFGALAQAAREAGLAGIVYDEEAYFGAMWDASSLCGGRALDACSARAADVGKHAMAAMIAAWPDVTVLAFYGPWVSEPKTAEYFKGYFPYNDVSFANPLMAPFFFGMAEAKIGTSATLIDGGEIYTLRDASQYARAYTWNKSELAVESALVPASLALVYASTVDVSFGVYDLPSSGVGMDAPTVQTTIANAMKASDGWVWFYTEQYDWWGTHNDPVPAAPKAWIDAVAAGRDAGAH
jgi:hypothetical protein